MSYADSTSHEAAQIHRRARRDAIERMVGRRWRACGSAAAGCSFSASAAAPATARTP